MTLGPRQKETLNEYAALLIAQPTIIRLQVTIQPWRRYTREEGGGSGFPIVLKCWECYPEGEYPMRGAFLSNCTEKSRATEKGQEIARYLVTAGCPKDRVRLKWERRSINAAS